MVLHETELQLINYTNNIATQLRKFAGMSIDLCETVVPLLGTLSVKIDQQL
ncbi:hypothetical protein FM109_14640 [Vibrio casei]|nr:hypothetical protein FM109_14640 [Vibrio casei]